MADSTDIANPIPGAPQPRLGSFRLALFASALVLTLALAGCSSSSSSSKDSDDEKSDQESSQTEVKEEPVAEDTAADDEGDTDTDTDTVEPFNSGALVRRLDRLVTATDTRILHSGLAADAVPASLSLSALEERLKSAQAHLRAMRPPAPPDGASQ